MRAALRRVNAVELIVASGIFLSLAGVSLPRSIRAAQDDDASGCRVIELEVRAALARWFYGKRDGKGAARYPSLAELRTPGLVLGGAVPPNPLGGTDPCGVRSASSGERLCTGEEGWAYDEGTGDFWSNVGEREEPGAPGALDALDNP